MIAGNMKKPGYKKTQAGSIPEDWECVPLHRVAFVQSGTAKGRRLGGKVRELPYLRVANVQDGYVDLTDIKTISIQADEIERYSLKRGDVLFTEGGDFDKLGRGCVWDAQINPCLHQNHVFAVRPCDGLLSRYLAAVAAGPHGKRYFLNSSKQSTNLASINSSQLKSFPIPIPPLAEQQKIAEILSTWDDAIEETRRLIEAKKRRKNGLMEELLAGKRRLRGFKEQWRTHGFSEFCRLRGEKADPKSHGGEVRCIELEHIEKDSGRLLGTVSVQKQASMKNRFRKGDVLFGKLRPYLRKFIRADFDGACSTEIWVLVPKEGTVTSEYLFFLVQTREFLKAASISCGSKMPRGEFSNLASTRFALPRIEEQSAISGILSAADRDIHALKRKLAALEKQKRGLMQKLLTGEVRMKV